MCLKVRDVLVVCLKVRGVVVCKGERCPCGVWMTPAFHVQKAKVDLCQRLLVATATSTPKSANVAAMSTYCKPTTNRDRPSLTLRPISSPDGLSD